MFRSNLFAVKLTKLSIPYASGTHKPCSVSGSGESSSLSTCANPNTNNTSQVIITTGIVFGSSF